MISIITACYNAADTLPTCLRSVQMQTCAAEHVVVDGGSEDGTCEFLTSFEKENPSLKWESGEDAGIYDAMNKGIARASGEIVGILNADDWYIHDRVLENVIHAFKDPKVEAVFGDLVYVKQEEISGKWNIHRHWKSSAASLEKLKAGWMPPHPTLFVRRSLYQEYGGFRLDLGSAADYEWMVRVLGKERIHALYLNDLMVCMRAGGVSNQNVQNRLNANRNDRRAWQVNALSPKPWIRLAKPLNKISQFLMKDPQAQLLVDRSLQRLNCDQGHND